MLCLLLLTLATCFIANMTSSIAFRDSCTVLASSLTMSRPNAIGLTMLSQFEPHLLCCSVVLFDEGGSLHGSLLSFLFAAAASDTGRRSKRGTTAGDRRQCAGPGGSTQEELRRHGAVFLVLRQHETWKDLLRVLAVTFCG